MVTLHAVVISWDGMYGQARAIAQGLKDHVDRLSVIYSNKENRDETGPGDWVKVPQAWFFGRKFKRSLELHGDEEIMLQIQADASFHDWKQVANRCRASFQDLPKLGIWAPELSWTPYDSEQAVLGRLGNTPRYRVAQTDGVVWALPKRLLSRLEALNYDENNFGWGIDWAAIAHAHASGLDVVRDTAIHIKHPESRGYPDAEAKKQMEAFLKQLNADEKSTYRQLRDRVPPRKSSGAQPQPATQPPAAAQKPAPAPQKPAPAPRKPAKPAPSPLADYISDVIVSRGTVWANGTETLADADILVAFGDTAIPLERMKQAPDLSTAPKMFDLIDPASPLALSTLNDQGNYQPANVHSLRVRFKDADKPCTLPVSAPLPIPGDGQDYTVMAYLASHRSRARLRVHLQTADGLELRDLSTPFRLTARGGTTLEDFQLAAIDLPALDEDAIATLFIDYEGRVAGQSEPPIAFLVAPFLTGAAADSDVVLPALLSLSDKPRPAWYRACVPSQRFDAEQGIDLVMKDTRIGLLPAVSTKVTLLKDYGHTLELRASQKTEFSAWINGAPAFSLALSPELKRLRIPARYLTGEHSLIQLRDKSGTHTFWETWFLPPRRMPGLPFLLSESRPPFPTDAFAQTPQRFAGLRAHCADPAGAGDLAQLTRALDALEAGHDRLTPAPLAFPQVEAPEVSVVIPAHNKFSVTYACLCGLLLAWNRASFEVILVDDASSDETAGIEALVSGITVIRNDKPQRFLRACNAGVAAARGKYIALLNNDTEPTTGWLDALIDAFGRFDNVGLAGAKLLYPDGKLQDAGGIIWNSGNPWNYGARQNPWEPRFSYARQVDYLTGAAMMTTRAIWQEVGGFSDYLEPMYFEDTDFAFKLREAGYTTWFVPASVVYHYEGMTSGTDISTGFKRYQEENRAKFKRRWAKAFAGNGQEGQDPNLQKDRGITGRVLFIDYTTPTPDQSAGSYAAVEEIKLVQSLGYKVTFLPENLAHFGSYTEELQKMGVEVITAPFYLNPGEFLRDRAKEFDAFYITRYYVVNKVIKQIRTFNPTARVLMNNADLHFLRTLRKATAENDPKLMEEMRKVRTEELDAMRKVDLVLSYNETEHAVIDSHAEGTVKIMKCPWVVELPETVPPRDGRSGLSFLGSFQHHPNVEGISWFAHEVMGRLAQQRPELVLSIYGSKMGDEIEALRSPAITPKGYVEDIAAAFDPHLIFVAPLLSGAGIKGKVLSALAYGIPCILSPLAAEGIGLRHGYDCMVAHNPDEWIAFCEQLCGDAGLWQTLSDNGRRLVMQKYSFAQGRKEMAAAFESVEMY